MKKLVQKVNKVEQDSNNFVDDIGYMTEYVMRQY